MIVIAEKNSFIQNLRQAELVHIAQTKSDMNRKLDPNFSFYETMELNETKKDDQTIAT